MPGIQGVICGVDYMQFNCKDPGLGLAQRSMGFNVCCCPCTAFLLKQRAGIGCAANTTLPLGLLIFPCVPVSCISFMER